MREGKYATVAMREGPQPELPESFSIAGHKFRPTGHESFICEFPNGKIHVARHHGKGYWKPKKQQTWVASISRYGNTIQIASKGKPVYFRMAFSAGARALQAWFELEKAQQAR